MRHTQVLDISTIHAGVDPVDIYRLPEDGQESGWRGPADLVELDLANNSALIKYQGMPYSLPLRHIRKHLVLFEHKAYHTYMTMVQNLPISQAYPVFKTSESQATDILHFMDLVDGQEPGKDHQIGWIIDADSKYCMVPQDWTQGEEPLLLTLAKQVAKHHMRFEQGHGLICGTCAKRFPPVKGASFGILITWLRSDRTKYTFDEILPRRQINLAAICGASWSMSSAVLIYSFTDNMEQVPVIQDKSTIYDSPDMSWGSPIDKSDFSVPYEFSFDDVTMNSTHPSHHFPPGPPGGPSTGSMPFAPEQPPMPLPRPSTHNPDDDDDEDGEFSRSRTREHVSWDLTPAEASLNQSPPPPPAPPAPPSVPASMPFPGIDIPISTTPSNSSHDMQDNNTSFDRSRTRLYPQPVVEQASVQTDTHQPLLPIAELEPSSAPAEPESGSVPVAGTKRNHGDVETSTEIQAEVCKAPKNDRDDDHGNSPLHDTGARSSTDPGPLVQPVLFCPLQFPNHHWQSQSKDDQGVTRARSRTTLIQNCSIRKTRLQ